MAPSMCLDPCGTRWGSWFQAILYHISAHFPRTFGVYAVRMFLLKMPHKTDMPNCQVSRVHEVSPERGTVSTHRCCVDWWLCWWNLLVELPLDDVYKHTAIDYHIKTSMPDYTARDPQKG